MKVSKIIEELRVWLRGRSESGREIAEATGLSARTVDAARRSGQWWPNARTVEMLQEYREQVSP